MAGRFSILMLYVILAPELFEAGLGQDFSDANKESRLLNDDELGRRKRATFAEIGLVGLNNLLKETRFVYSDGLNQIFTKTGGYSQAIKDFESVNPTMVKVKKPKGGIERMSGHFGNKRIILERDLPRQLTKVIVERQPTDFRSEAKFDLQGENIIIYSD